MMPVISFSSEFVYTSLPYCFKCPIELNLSIVKEKTRYVYERNDVDIYLCLCINCPLALC